MLFLRKLLISFYVFKYNKIIGYDKKQAKAIKTALGIDTTHGEGMLEVFRGIRSQIANLLSGNYNLI
jgi:hypothetical protein